MEGVERIIAGFGAGFGDSTELIGQHIQLAGERCSHHVLFGLIDDLVEILTLPDKTLIGAGQGLFGVDIDKDAVDDGGEFITGGSVNRPFAGQTLIIGDNFFGDDIDRNRF